MSASIALDHDSTVVPQCWIMTSEIHLETRLTPTARLKLIIALWDKKSWTKRWGITLCHRHQHLLQWAPIKSNSSIPACWTTLWQFPHCSILTFEPAAGCLPHSTLWVSVTGFARGQTPIWHSSPDSFILSLCWITGHQTETHRILHHSGDKFLAFLAFPRWILHHSLDNRVSPYLAFLPWQLYIWLRWMTDQRTSRMWWFLSAEEIIRAHCKHRGVVVVSLCTEWGKVLCTP